MKLLKNFKFQLRPNGQQACDIQCFAGTCRFVFKTSQPLQNEHYEAINKYVPHIKMVAWLVKWKKALETQCLKDSPSQPLQQTLEDLKYAYKYYFQKQSDFPLVIKTVQYHEFPYYQGVRPERENNGICLPKLGKGSCRNRREVIGEVKNITVSQSCCKWYVRIQVQSKISDPRNGSDTMVGIDVGIAKQARLLEGTIVELVNSLIMNQGKLAKLQYKMSSKLMFSNSWKKTKCKVEKLHARIKNLCRDHLRKVSETISKKHVMIVIEDLKVANMSRSAAGTVSQPRCSVRAKSGLNYSIFGQAAGAYS